MAYLRRKGDRDRYWVLNDQCIGCECFQPGVYYSRGATGSGSRNTGAGRPTCMRNAYHGCPDEAERGYSAELVSQRKREGWKRG